MKLTGIIFGKSHLNDEKYRVRDEGFSLLSLQKIHEDVSQKYVSKEIQISKVQLIIQNFRCFQKSCAITFFFCVCKVLTERFDIE